MPSVSTKLLSAGIVMEGDLWRVASGITAVNPAKYAAVKAYLDGINFGPLQEYLSRGYAATNVSISDDASRVITLLHRAAASPVQNLARQNGCKMKGAQSTPSKMGTYTFVARGVPRFIERYVTNDAGDKLYWSGTISGVNYSPLTSLITNSYETFAGVAPLGALTTFTASSVSNGGGNGGINSLVFSAERPVTNVAAASSLATQSKLAWPLIEGPALLTFGEIINWSDLTFEYYGVTLADVAEAVASAKNRWNYTDEQLSSLLDACTAQPRAGFVFFRAGAEPLNPFYLIDGARDCASDALANAGVVDGVDYGLVRQKWVPGAELIAGFSPYTTSTVTAGSFVARVLSALGETASAVFKVQSGVVSLLVDSSISTPVGQFMGVIRQLLSAGKGCVVTPGVSSSGDDLTDCDNINARIVATRSFTPVGLSRMGDSSGIGPALVTGITQPLSTAQTKMARAFLQPSYISML